MQQILDGKLYDTETADRLARWSNGKFQNDFYYDYSNLYKTKKGQFFITGNTQLEYAEDATTDMRLLDKEEVLRWIEYRQLEPSEIDDFKAHFEVEEG